MERLGVNLIGEMDQMSNIVFAAWLEHGIEHFYPFADIHVTR